MPRINKLPHFGQIATTKRTIKGLLGDNNLPIALNTLYLLAAGTDNAEQKLRLYSVCARLYYLSKLVYYDGEKYTKPPRNFYERHLFNPHAEDKNDISMTLSYWNDRHSDMPIDISNQLVDDVWNSFEPLKELWLAALSCVNEQIYIPEYAYAMEYVLTHKDSLSEIRDPFKILMKGSDEKGGISAYFDEIIEGLF